MSKNIKIEIAAGIIIIIAVVIGGFVWLDSKQQERQGKQPAQVSVLKSQPTIDETAGWQTYSNLKHGFEIKYPQEAEVVLAPAKGVDGLVYIGTSGNNGGYDYGISFDDVGGANYLSPEKWYLQYYEDRKQEASKSDVHFNLAASGENVTLNGYSAYKTSNFNFDSSIISFFIGHSGAIYKLSYKDESANDPDWKKHEEVIIKMLSTFKFIESQQEMDGRISSINWDLVQFDGCGKIEKYSNESWYRNVQDKLKADDQPLNAITDVCQSIDKSLVIILTSEGFCQSGLLYQYSVTTDKIYKANFDDKGRGCVAWPAEFGKRDGGIINLQGSDGDAGCGRTMYYEYDFAKNIISLSRECGMCEGDSQESCSNF